jgi:hypothetical protein
MSRPSQWWRKLVTKVCLCSGALLGLVPGSAWASTNSTSVGPGTLSWTRYIEHPELLSVQHLYQLQFHRLYFYDFIRH